MALKGRSSADRTARWEVLITNLSPEVSQMPHVADDLKALLEMLPKARILETQQEDLRSQARVASDQLKKMLTEGDHLRARLGSALKAKFGFTDATLAKYGFRPRTRSGKRKGKTPPAEGGADGPATATAPGTHPAVPATPMPGK
jgi:hypothetical protein